MSKLLHDTSSREEINEFITRRRRHCPACDQRVWRHPKLKIAFLAAGSFFAVMGAAGFFWGLAMVLGS